MDISHIVVGTDFSDPSERAVQAAAEWAKRFGARVTLAHALALPELDDDELEQPIPEHRELEAAVHDHLDRVLERLLGGVESKAVMIRARSASHALSELADREGADLLIVATHGRTGFTRVFLGSVAEQVIRLAHCPVMTVRTGGEETF
ncbi:MAG TPA: universal stress protein [Sandaracinaceae bacterium LLY-WYZ-13_1]|nr:universal stress protein [Sandaracinaceae bacterium LLY-WYZ-13_1]